MSTLTFDTLKFSRRLKEAGVPEKQAEAEAEALAEAFQTNTQTLVTKADLKAEMIDVRTRLALVEKLQWGILLGVIGLIIKAFFVAS